MRSKILFLCGLALMQAAIAANPSPALDAPVAAATDPTYRLNSGDHLSVTIFGEPDLAAQQMIDRNGRVRLPLIGDVPVAGRTVRETESLIESTYRKEEILKSPQVTVSMLGYAPREVTLLGAVRAPGTFQFPPDTVSMDIRDAIARQGGFTPVAKGDSVAVTRRQEGGKEVTTVVDVDRMMYGRSRKKDNITTFFVYPGDRIFVPERLF
jgi:protein involved in polysaccharide export with SLBB domain